MFDPRKSGRDGGCHGRASMSALLYLSVILIQWRSAHLTSDANSLGGQQEILGMTATGPTDKGTRRPPRRAVADRRKSTLPESSFDCQVLRGARRSVRPKQPRSKSRPLHSHSPSQGTRRGGKRSE